MIFKTTSLLISLIWCVQSKLYPKDIPVDVLDLTNIVVDGYQGTMDANTLELFSNARSLTLQNSNFTVFNENFLNPLIKVEKLTFCNNEFGRVINDNSTHPWYKILRELSMIDSKSGPYTEGDFKLTALVKTLEKLYFFKMEVPTLHANALNGSNLLELDILNSDLSTIEDGALNGMDKLELLNLQHNKLKTVPTASLAAVKTLKELNLQNNLIEKITTADIPPLPNLEKLILSNNPIKQIDLTGLKKKLPNIKEIDCSGIGIDASKAEGLPIFSIEILDTTINRSNIDKF